MILTYVCPTIAKNTPEDPVRKILCDLGISTTKCTVHFGEREALVQVDVSDADALKIQTHKDVKIVTDITKVAVEYADDLGKNGVAKAIESIGVDGVDFFIKPVMVVE